MLVFVGDVVREGNCPEGDVLHSDAPASAARKMPVDQRRRLIFATGPSLLSELTVDTQYITPGEIYTPPPHSQLIVSNTADQRHLRPHSLCTGC